MTIVGAGLRIVAMGAQSALEWLMQGEVKQQGQWHDSNNNTEMR